MTLMDLYIQRTRVRIDAARVTRPLLDRASCIAYLIRAKVQYKYICIFPHIRKTAALQFAWNWLLNITKLFSTGLIGKSIKVLVVTVVRSGCKRPQVIGLDFVSKKYWVLLSLNHSGVSYFPRTCKQVTLLRSVFRGSRDVAQVHRRLLRSSSKILCTVYLCFYCHLLALTSDLN